MGQFQQTERIKLETFDLQNVANGREIQRNTCKTFLTDTHELPHMQKVTTDITADSHPGFTRKNNEDSFAYYFNKENQTAMLAVADGIGGHENGDIASNITMKLLLSSWRDFQAKQQIDSSMVKQFLKNELEEINTSLYKINSVYNVAYPMGTTTAIVVLLKEAAITAHAGDSRVYRLRGRTLERLTSDHSFIAELIRNGTITEKDALTHPFAHVISKSIGPAEALEPEIHVYDKLPGDRFLLCTDGLNLHVSDADLRTVLLNARSSAAVIRKLLGMTLQKGGCDNVTMVSCFS